MQRVQQTDDPFFKHPVHVPQQLVYAKCLSGAHMRELIVQRDKYLLFSSHVALYGVTIRFIEAWMAYTQHAQEYRSALLQIHERVLLNV